MSGRQLRPVRAAGPHPAADVLAGLRARGIDLWPDAGRVRHRARDGAMTVHLLRQLKLHEAALLALLAREAAAARGNETAGHDGR